MAPLEMETAPALKDRPGSVHSSLAPDVKRQLTGGGKHRLLAGTVNWLQQQ